MPTSSPRLQQRPCRLMDAEPNTPRTLSAIATMRRTRGMLAGRNRLPEKRDGPIMLPLMKSKHH
jgi:hypothetical protein